MDIKDSYLHGTVGVVKSINVDGDKIKYTLADVANTTKTVALPLANIENGGIIPKTYSNSRVLMSKNGTPSWEYVPVALKTYSTLNYNGVDVNNGEKHWFTIATNVSDYNTYTFHINTYAHSDIIFNVVRGFTGGYINVLNSSTGSNQEYAYINAVRLLKNGKLQIRLNIPNANDATKVQVKVSVTHTHTGDLGLQDTLVLDNTNYATENIIQTVEMSGTNGSMIAKSFIGDLKGIADSATTLVNKPSLAYSGNTITVTVGGKTSDAFTVPYADSAKFLDGITKPISTQETSSFDEGVDAKYYKFCTIKIPVSNWLRTNALIKILQRNGIHSSGSELVVTTTTNGSGIISVIQLRWVQKQIFDNQIDIVGTKVSDNEYDLYLVSTKKYTGYDIHYMTGYLDKYIFFKSSWSTTPPVVDVVADFRNLSSSILGGSKGSLLYQSAANKTTTLNIGSNGQVLKVNSSGLPQWTTEQIVSNSANGLAPKVINTNTVTVGSAYYVLASSDGSATPSWYKLPANSFSNDDTKVTQTNTTDSAYYRVLLSGNANDTTETTTARKSTNLIFNPSTGNLKAVSLNLNGDIVINDGTNKDRFIKFQYNNTDSYGWRIGYLGNNTTNGSNNNALSFESYSNSTWNKALIFDHSTRKATFSADVTATTFIGNLDGTYVNKLTGYSKATSVGNIATNDTLNTALGKLEYKADWACDWITSVTADDTDTLVNKWGEIVNFLDSVAEGTDIIDEFVTRKTSQTITGEKTFTNSIVIPNKGSNVLSGMTNASIMYNGYTKLDDTRYHPILGVKTSSENVVNIGAYRNNVGFYGYKNGRTENNWDWQFIFDSSTGALSHSSSITATKFIGNVIGDVSGSATKLNGNSETSYLRFRGDIPKKYVDLTTYTSGAPDYANYNTGIYTVTTKNDQGALLYSDILVHFEASGSTSALELLTNYSNSARIKVRKNVDSNRVSGAWKELAWYSDIPTKLSQLTNDIGVTTQKKQTTIPEKAGWYRIASSSQGVNPCLGDFEIRGTISGYHTVTKLTASINYGYAPGITVISSSSYHNSPALSRVRMVYKDKSWSGQYAYLEVYCPLNSAVRIQTQLVNGYGWTLQDAQEIEEIPSGYTTKEVSLTDNTFITTGDLTLHTTSGDSPALIFQCGSTNDDLFDWGMKVSTGTLKFQLRESNGSWTDVLSLRDSANRNIVSAWHIIPDVTAGRNLGAVSYKWADVYATTFNGNLKGNVTGNVSGSSGSCTGNAATATTLKPTAVISAKAFSLINTTWTDTGYIFANLATGTYAVQVTSGTNLVASGIMSVYKNLSDSIGDEIPLHVYGTAGWRPYLRTYQNKLQISSNDASATSRTVTIKIAQIL